MCVESLEFIQISNEWLTIPSVDGGPKEMF